MEPGHLGFWRVEKKKMPAGIAGQIKFHIQTSGSDCEEDGLDG